MRTETAPITSVMNEQIVSDQNDSADFDSNVYSVTDYDSDVSNCEYIIDAVFNDAYNPPFILLSFDYTLLLFWKNIDDSIPSAAAIAAQSEKTANVIRE